MSSNTVSKVAIAAGVAAAAYFAYKLITDRQAKKQANAVVAPSAAPSAAGVESFPVVDLSAFLAGTDKAQIAKDCKVIADNLHKYGLLIVKDPRVDDKENDVFIDMMEKYFEQPAEATARDARPEVFYQVGVTPSGVERARDHCDKVAKMPDSERPVTECPPGVDPKWRFFWRIGDRPKETRFPQMNSAEVVPAAFPQWPQIMNRWGGLILQTVFTVSKMAANGFDLPENTFHDMLQLGPHLLAPTGSDLAKFGQKGTVFASYHYDLNFLTIHGRSRFPGLYVWTREGKKVLVRVPPNCLLLQAGKQFEWVTGGHVLAGFHEVVVCNETLQAIDRAKTNNKSLWRISSTLFSHIASDNQLFPLSPFATEEAIKKYPATFAGDQVQEELNAIKLARAM